MEPINVTRAPLTTTGTTMHQEHQLKHDKKLMKKNMMISLMIMMIKTCDDDDDDMIMMKKKMISLMIETCDFLYIMR